MRSFTSSTRRLAAEPDDEIGERARRDRRAHRDPVDLALELGQDEADRLRGARRRRDEVDRRRARPPQVLVREVEDHLVVRVRVDRRHEAGLDLAELVQHLRERSDAVRRAGGVRDDVVRLRVVGVVVHAEHDRDVRIGRRRRDDDLLRARVEVLLRARAVGEEARRLEHDVDAEVAPRKRRRIALGEHPHLLAGRAQDAVGELDLALERAEVRVVAEQVGHRLRVAEIVERDDLDVGPERLLRTEEVPPDAAEPVDADANAHSVLLRLVEIA